MSVKKTLSLNDGEVVKVNDPVNEQQVSAKRRRSDRCFSFNEISIEPGKSLKDLDSNKFKIDIKRWAKAVVAYARQVSSRFGSTRRSGRIGSSRDSSQDSM
ncbi:unnamed protein product [Dovyalis caffra]|uniref:Uncharacterized protein n=1 Tax=Dovyalis caffra TaxID=77055 RepID=A0AAV1SRZ7_9ROSI|nr:unnamed protein product [Dovyalis caffra]